MAFDLELDARTGVYRIIIALIGPLPVAPNTSNDLFCSISLLTS